MATPPTRVGRFAPTTGNYSSTTSPKTSNAFNMQVGDRFWLQVQCESATGITTPTPTVSAGAITWTKQAQQPAAANSNVSGLIGWTGVCTTAATGVTISLTRPTSDTTLWWGFSCTQVRGSDGVGVIFTGNNGTGSGAPSVAQTVAADSLVLFNVNDWNAVDGASRAYRMSATEANYFTDPARHTVYGAYTLDTAAGTYTAGLTAPSTMRWGLVGVEFLGAASGTTPVTATRSTTWDVLAAATTSRATTWDTLARTTPTRATSWDVRVAVTAQRSTTWNVDGTLAQVTATRATSWTTRQTVAGTRSTTWDVRREVTASRATTWDARTTISATRATSWDTASTISRALATSWDVRTEVTAQRSTAWNVDSTRVTATATRATTWRVLARPAATRATTWDVRTLASNSRSTTWDVRTVVARQTATSWRVLRGAAASRVTSWRTLQAVAAARSSSWLVDSDALPPPTPPERVIDVGAQPRLVDVTATPRVVTVTAQSRLIEVFADPNEEA